MKKKICLLNTRNKQNFKKNYKKMVLKKSQRRPRMTGLSVMTLKKGVKTALNNLVFQLKLI
jgi:hypothetical protein